ncbi:MAG: S-DNA-T family DNA segregation ATPase FtsK/SpoIIIE [Kiritimatiellia bacterium]
MNSWLFAEMAGKAAAVNGFSLRRDFWGFGMLILCLVLFLSVLSYQSADVAAIQSPPNSPPHNLIGVFGAWTAFILFMSLGVGGYLVPLVLGIMGVLLLVRSEERVGFKFMWLWICLFGVVCLLELLPGALDTAVTGLNTCSPGGLTGKVFGQGVLIRLIGNIGSWILLAGLVLSGIVILLEIHLGSIFQGINAEGMGLIATLRERVSGFFLDRGAAEEEEEIEVELKQVRKKLEGSVKKKRPAKAKPKPKPAESEDEEPAVLIDLEPEPESAPVPISVREPEPEPEPEPVPERGLVHVDEDEAEKGGAFSQLRKKKKAAPAATPVDDFEPIATARPGHWVLPPIHLLEQPPVVKNTDHAEIQKTADILKKTLAEFNIDAEITNVEHGPVVTSFEVRPAAGVRVEKISSLSNNLALALKAESIRVQAPIPGKGVVGIEIPNSKSTVVYAREILESKAWKSDKAALPLNIGVDVSGRKIVGDLAEMPHLLIAGATGSGKSVCMNSLLAGLLMSRTPDQLRLILVDPKIVEFTAFNHLPHLVVPVITDAKKVGLGLRWAINEMEKRYKMFAKVGVRNIKSFNSRKVERQTDLFDEGAVPEERAPDTLPYIVIVIDELADLMLVAQAEIENSIARLAQLSRAVGIHMILATQRPSVNVITGTIKANFPTRIAFQVAQKVDSRTILDAIGADKLLGKGDMLFLPPGVGKLIRSQGAWTSDDEINRIVDFIKRQGEPDYVMQVKEKIENTTPELPGNDEDDELIAQAVEIIRQTRRASTSSLQRRLRIGYNRAARLMDLLEERGVVGPPQGSDPREIMIDLDGEIPENPAEESAADEVDDGTEEDE